MLNTDKSLHKTISKFSEEISKYWPKKNPQPSPEESKLANNFGIICEGFFAESGPNYVIRIVSIAKQLEEIFNTKTLAIIQNGKKNEPLKYLIWKAFDIEDTIGIYDEVYANFSSFKKEFIKALTKFYYYFAKFLFFIKKEEWFFKIKLFGLEIGDLIYDEMIKYHESEKDITKKIYSIKSIKRKYKYIFNKTFIYIFSCSYLYKRYNPKIYLTTHTQYSSYGIPCRYFAKKGVQIIETNDDLILFYQKNSTPKFNQGLKELIKKKINETDFDQNKLHEIDNILNSRITGKEEQIDVKMAYHNKKIYDQQSLRDELKITNNKPMVFIFAHVFADAPRCLTQMLLFKDYFDWLEQTLKHISTNKNVNWIVKPHPSSKTYNEIGQVKRMIDELDSKENVFLCPENLSTASVINCAKAIITGQGTVGMEFSCFGIPVVIIGSAFYSGFGFNIEPKTKQEYSKILDKIDLLSPLNESQILIAKKVIYSFFSLANKDFSLIDTKIKDLVWGCSQDQDLNSAYQLMTERLKTNDPRKLYFCELVRSYFEKKNP